MYIVTGGAGFIGSAFVAKLNEEGIKDILIVDELGESIKWKNLTNKTYTDYLHKDKFLELLKSNKIPAYFINGDIKGIIHMGACSTTTEQNMDYLMENNFHYTRTLAEYAVDNGVRFIYASSAATYGDGSNGYSDDEASLQDLTPLNRYGYSKHIFDLWARENKKLDKIVGLKFFNVYGPNEYHKGDMLSVPYRAYHQIKESGKVKLFRSYKEHYKNGEQKRDFVYVKDCCSVMWWLLQNPRINGIFNLGTGAARTWNDLAGAAFSALNQTKRIEYIDMPEKLRVQYQYFTQAEMQKLKDAGYTDEFYSLEEGINDYLVNYLDTDNPYY